MKGRLILTSGGYMDGQRGEELDNLIEFINLIKQSNLKVEGIYTHFSSADIDEEYTNRPLSSLLAVRD